MPLQALLRATMLSGLLAAAAHGQGVIAGAVVDADGRPLALAAVRAAPTGGATGRETSTDSAGAFHIGGLSAGIYVVTVRRVGYRSAELAGVRVTSGQTRMLNVTLTQTARQLSTIDVVTSPTAVDVGTSEISTRLDRSYTELLPGGRDASSLLALLPGTRKDQLWGGAAGVSNDYRLDGVSMNHPGVGGDFLSIDVDWIESMEVKGLGAGAEYGNFQGGVINAITKSGSNRHTVTLRTNYESAALTETNLRYDEQGVEQEGRREVGAEVGGPVLRDRLFYFVAGQYVARDLRAAPLVSGFLPSIAQSHEAHDDARGMVKFTWLPTPSQRADALFGASSSRVEHNGLNGVDAPDALAQVRAPSQYFSLSWTMARPTGALDARVGGFTASETTGGYQGDSVPGIQVYQFGREPQYQNAAFSERRRPSGLSGTLQWRSEHRLAGTDHQLSVGTDWGLSHWRDDATRNGGLTWRPYTIFAHNFNPAAPATWATTGSDWGGEVHLNAAMSSAALFVQDNISVGARLLLTPGLRLTRWTGSLLSTCATCPDLGRVVTPTAADERFGITWDVTGRGTLAVKTHAGRYHQGMTALFFDRAEGANAYSDARSYFLGPKITDPRTSFTVAERDAAGSGFPVSYDLVKLSESGRVTLYKQPYVDQFMLSVEKSFGPKWKAELTGLVRRNGNITGIVDRNAKTNYTEIHNVRVDSYFVPGSIKAPNGGPLVIPTAYFANVDLKRMKALSPRDSTIAGFDTAYITQLKWDPDLVLTSIPEARRNYQQATLLVRTVWPRWRGEASLTAARLEGNVAGVAGYGAAGDRFSPGPFARPNEAINMDGILPDAQQLEGKLWLTAQIWRGLSGGILYTHTYGETYTPSVQFESRYDYRANFAPIPTELFRSMMGQSVLLEPRGSRHYPSRDVVDLHLEWRLPARTVLSADLFNATGTDVVTLVNTNVGDQSANDPTSLFNAVRQRVAPRRLRLGLRIE